MKSLGKVCSGIAVLAMSAVAALVSCSTSTPDRDDQGDLAREVDAVTAPSANVIPCEARAVAVTANTAGVTVHSGARVDSYDSTLGAYGGSNVGRSGSVRAATSIVQNGTGVIDGTKIPNSPANLNPIAVPSNARKLPLGASSPGDVVINTSAQSLTLTPGSYVVRNLTVNSPGAIRVQPTGRVNIWVTGSLILGGNENLNGSPNNLTFLVGSTNTVNVNSNGKLFGNIYAPRAVVNLNSVIYGTLIGKQVTLNSGAAVHFDQNLTCPGPAIAAKTPGSLPTPPRKKGCYLGTANGWLEVECTSTDELADPFKNPEPAIRSVPFTSGGATQTIPFEFGEVETTFVTFGAVQDSRTGSSLSVQANTNFFRGPNNHDDWVQFVVQAWDIGALPQLAICVWNFDVTQFNLDPSTGLRADCVGGGATGMATYGVKKRPGAYQQYDFATVGGSTYADDLGASVIGMVARLSFFDPDNDPGNDRGLYAVVAPDLFGLAGRWTEVSGSVFGLGNGSSAIFTNTSVLTRTLAGSCANATGPAPEIPWPGVCPDQPPLLPHTTLANVNSTGETSNLSPVGMPNSLAAATNDLVYTQYLTSTNGMCHPGGKRAFVKDSAEDTGVVPSNAAGHAFWESPDVILVPAGSPVSVDTSAGETLLTPGGQFDVYIRVNNDFGCDAVTGAKALVYIADPSALSAQWTPITNGQYLGATGNSNGFSVPAGGRALLGPFRFTAPSSGIGDGHKCMISAILADGQPAVANTFDAPASFQVAQRNIEISSCRFPFTNATTSDGNVEITLSATGARPGLTGNDVEMSFDDPTSSWFNAWQPGAGATYAVSRNGAATVVRLGQPSVTLARVPLLAGESRTSTGGIFLNSGEPDTTLSISATLRDSNNSVLVTNGGSCIGSAQSPE